MKFSLALLSLLPALSQAIQPSNEFLTNPKFDTECMKSGCMPFLQAQLDSCEKLFKTIPTPDKISEETIYAKLSYCLCGTNPKEFVLEIQQCLSCFKDVDKIKNACNCVWPTPVEVMLGANCNTKSPEDPFEKLNITKIREQAKNETNSTMTLPKDGKGVNVNDIENLKKLLDSLS